MLADFYNSKAWLAFRDVIIHERTKEDDFIYDEVTNKPILKKYDIILHHKEELTEENYQDVNISLNPDNIMVVSFKTHNMIHDRLGLRKTKGVYLVYGSPLSGKSTWVHENMSEGDLIIDMDNIWQCVSGCDRYVKPNRLNAVVFAVRDNLLEAVKYRRGKWQSCYIIGGYPYKAERERLCNTLGAREIYIDTSKEECMQRLEADTQRDKVAWTKYIDDWWLQHEGGY